MPVSLPALVLSGTLLVLLPSSLGLVQYSKRCFRLAYEDREPGDTSMVPSQVILRGGGRRGTVTSTANPADTIGFWKMFQNSAARWVQSSRDSLQLQFSNGFTFVTFNLSSGPDSLRGIATIQFDFGDPAKHPRYKVVARRTACPDR